MMDYNSFTHEEHEVDGVKMITLKPKIPETVRIYYDRKTGDIKAISCSILDQYENSGVLEVPYHEGEGFLLGSKIVSHYHVSVKTATHPKLKKKIEPA